MIIYDIKDNLSGSFQNLLIVALNDEIVKRLIRNGIKSGQGLPPTMCESPEDFSLYQLGSYDSDTGSIVSSVSFVSHFQEIMNGQESKL